MKGFLFPRTATGIASILPDPPWHYSGTMLTLEYRTDISAVEELLPLGFSLADEDPGAVALIWADWQSCSDSYAEILDPNTIELIKTIHYPQVNSTQGLIWYYKNENERTLFGHNGGDIGSLTEMFISFSNNIGVILLSNSSNYNAIIQIENALFNYAEENDFTISGDINLDNLINIQDIILVINLVLVNEYSTYADLNLDETVDVLDIVQLVNIILN